MIDYIFIAGIILLFLLLFGLLYFHAEKIYDFQHNLRNADNVYFKILGSGSKNIDQKEKWIKNYKRYMLLIVVLILSIAISVGVGLE
jgi:hypothetical protein